MNILTRNFWTFDGKSFFPSLRRACEASADYLVDDPDHDPIPIQSRLYGFYDDYKRFILWKEVNDYNAKTLIIQDVSTGEFFPEETEIIS